MEKNQILQSEWLDILFDGKNKNYGAYDLRKTYDRRLKTALIATLSITALFVTVILLANVNNNEIVALNAIDISLASIKDETKKIEPLPPIKKEQPKLETVAVNPPKIVKDIEVTPED